VQNTRDVHLNERRVSGFLKQCFVVFNPRPSEQGNL